MIDTKDRDLTEFDLIGVESVEDDPEDVKVTGEPYEYQYIDLSQLKSVDSIVDGKNLYSVRTYEEFKLLTDSLVADLMTNSNHKIAYDIETNAESPISSDAKVIGFSLASNSREGLYCIRESLDYTMSDHDWELISSRLREIFDIATRVVVHNCKYEVPYSENEFGYTFTDDKIDDTMVKCRVTYPNEPAGLKPASARLLGYSDWDVNLSIYIKVTKNLIKYLVGVKPNKLSANERSLYESVFVSKYNDDPTELYKLVGIGTEPNELSAYILQILQLMMLDSGLSRELFILYRDKILKIVEQGGLSTSVIPYSLIPSGMISKYGALDSIATYELDDYLNDAMIKRNSDINNTLKEITNEDTNFDLRLGYDNVKKQFFAGISLEMSGAKWDDDVANREYNYYNRTAIESWMKLKDNPLFYPIFIKRNKYLLGQYIKEKSLELYETGVYSDDNPVAKWLKDKHPNHTVQKLRIKFNEIIEESSDGKKAKALTVSHKNLYSYFESELDNYVDSNLLYKLIDEKLSPDNIKTFNDLKYYFNPSSTSEDNISDISSVMISDEIRLAYILDKCNVELMDKKHWLDELGNVKQFHEGTYNLFKYLDDVNKYNKEVEGTDNPKVSKKDLFTNFGELLMYVDFSKDRVMYKVLEEGHKLVLENLKEPTMIWLYGLYQLTGLEIEDNPDTWSHNFQFLYYFRVYKKCIKMITSYIEGRVGRSSVAVVDKDNSDKTLPKRKRYYYDREVPYDKESEELLMSMEFSVCGAETGRWKSGLHTVPSGCTIKNIYRSRFKGGVIVAPDYSQMEIRAIASSANEDSMLEAFRNNEDIHLRNAAKVWKKAPEDILPSERRFSKMVSFAILYGADAKNIADNFMHGDLAGATDMLNKFYEAFPKLKTWIDAKHEEWMKTGYVTLLTNRLIKIPKPDYNDPKYKYKFSKGLRCAQNYPIQGAGNDIAGVVLFLILDQIRKHGWKSKGFSYVHDALYFDIHPMELFDVIQVINKYMNDYPINTYGMPAKADMVVGISMGQELEATEITKISDEEGSLVLKGYKDDFYELIESWKSVFSQVNVEELIEPYDEYITQGELFVPKKAISPYYGKHRTVVKCKVHLVK